MPSEMNKKERQHANAASRVNGWRKERKGERGGAWNRVERLEGLVACWCCMAKVSSDDVASVFLNFWQVEPRQVPQVNSYNNNSNKQKKKKQGPRTAFIFQYFVARLLLFVVAFTIHL